MAGSNSFTKNPQKDKYTPAFDSAEIYKNLSDSKANDVSSILSGILTPGESINFNREIKTPEKPKFNQYIEREQAVFINDHQKETAQSINNLRNEIKSLIPITENLNKDITVIPLQNISEANEYQRNFLQRIKTYISDFYKNASESNSWVEISSRKKNKRNAYWNKAKSGGTKYSESGEHSAARSAN